jgi:hypothetical protein
MRPRHIAGASGGPESASDFDRAMPPFKVSLPESPRIRLSIVLSTGKGNVSACYLAVAHADLYLFDPQTGAATTRATV